MNWREEWLLAHSISPRERPEGVVSKPVRIEGAAGSCAVDLSLS